MRNPGFRALVLLIVVTLARPGLARAEGLDLSALDVSAVHANAVQTNQSDTRRDSLWNGVLIGAAIGVGVGMFFLPQQICGDQDSECSVIVRGAIGLPVIAGSVGIGALVDGLNSRDHRSPGRVAGAKVNVSF